MVTLIDEANNWKLKVKLIKSGFGVKRFNKGLLFLRVIRTDIPNVIITVWYYIGFKKPFFLFECFWTTLEEVAQWRNEGR